MPGAHKLVKQRFRHQLLFVRAVSIAPDFADFCLLSTAGSPRTSGDRRIPCLDYQLSQRKEGFESLGSAKKKHLQPAPRIVRTRRIDVEIDIVDARLRFGVPIADAPRPISQTHVFDFFE